MSCLILLGEGGGGGQKSVALKSSHHISQPSVPLHERRDGDNHVFKDAINLINDCHGNGGGGDDVRS